MTVTRIAAEAEVSKRTLFAYFPSKEDLVIGAFADHQNEPAQVVASRQPDTGALATLRDHFISGLRAHDPATGLDDHPHTLAFVAMVLSTPALQARLLTYQFAAENALADALARDPHPFTESKARLVAAQILAVERTLANENRHRLNTGETADQRLPHAITDALGAFDLLSNGIDRPRTL